MTGRVKQAVIMVGGKGTRLHPLTNTVPKPALPVLDRPCLSYLISSFADAGVREIFLACGYKSDVLREAVGDGSDMGVDVTYSDEDAPLGTGGSMKALEGSLDPVFVAANGDTFADLDVGAQISEHLRSGAAVTVSLTHVDRPSEYGIVRVGADGRVEEFREKPNPEEVFSDLINAGIYVVDRGVLALVPEHAFYDFSKDLFPVLMGRGERLQGFELKGVWTDVGRPSDLIYANVRMASRLYGGRDWGERTAGCGIGGEFYLGPGAVIKNSEAHSSVLMRGCTVSGSSLSGSVLMPGCSVEGATVEGSILGPGCTIGRAAVVRGCVLGDGTAVKAGDVLVGVSRVEFIRSRAPLRIGIAGGGTDVDQYSSEKGGYVFNTTIDKYAYCTLSPREDAHMNVSSEYYGRFQAPLDGGPLKLDGNMDLIKAVTNYFEVKKGFDLIIRSDAPAGSGLGGSSTMIVSMIAAMVNWLDVDMSKKETAALAYHLEREVIGLKGGKQDQYAAVFGGFNSLIFGKHNVEVVPAGLSEDLINELQCRAVLCFTGLTHDSAAVIETQVRSYKEGRNDEALDRSKALAKEIRAALRHGDIDEAGRLLGQSWEYKKKFSDKITNPEIDHLYSTAMANGAMGGKVSGAGGGGFMFFISEYDKKAKLSRAMAEAGATMTNFMFEPKGAVSWRSRYDRRYHSRGTEEERGGHLGHRSRADREGRRHRVRVREAQGAGDLHGKRRVLRRRAAHLGGALR